MSTDPELYHSISKSRTVAMWLTFIFGIPAGVCATGAVLAESAVDLSWQWRIIACSPVVPALISGLLWHITHEALVYSKES